MRTQHHFCDILVKEERTGSLHKEMLDRPKLKDILQNNLQKCQGHESQGKAEDLHQTETKKQVNTMHNHGLDPFTLKGIIGTTGEFEWGTGDLDGNNPSLLIF